MLQKEKKIYQKNRAKMFGFSEFLDFLDILRRYYNTFYVEEQYWYVHKVIFKMHRLVRNS